jgi:hypothetical protein
MNNNIINLYVGNEVSDPGEQQLISRLQHDLADKGVPTTLYANFFPRARRTCQVDLLVRTKWRTAHVEIKSLNPSYPVFGGQNGPWEQQLPDGTRRSLGKNAGRQALEGTFAISDAMRNLARAGAVRGRDFKANVDTLVGIWQTVPAGSNIKTPPHVNVIGYADLIKRLSTPGPFIDWNDDEWDAFVRHLNLFQPEQETPAQNRRRTSAEAITDYRLPARASLGAGLKQLVDLGAADADRGPVSFAAIDRMVADAGVVALVGPPGFGKSFAARHLAVNHCDASRLVIWLRAGEYDKGRFSDLVARAMAPFSAERWTALVRPATEVGVAVTVVLDGLNECPEDLRPELMQQLQAFVLRYPAGILVTSTEVDGLSEILGSTILKAGAPDEVSRLALLDMYGARHPDRISTQFHTPYELSIAAQCESELEDDSSVAELHAAYIRRFAPTEQLRGGLRALATHLHTKLRSSVPLLEATVLHSPTLGLSAHQIDYILDCPLLDVEHQHIRFRHDLVGQFLAAEHLVHSTPSGTDLGRLLGLPVNQVLASSALAIEADPHTTCEALDELADPALLFPAITGAYGPAVTQLVTDRIRDVLRIGIAATDADALGFENGDALFGRWITDLQWTPTQQALLAVAGQGLTKGLFVDEVCELLARTDKACLHHARRLKTEGAALPVSTVIASTYSQARPADGHGPAACYVATAFELSWMMSRHALDQSTRGLSRRLAATTAPHPWGRLYLAALTANPEDLDDQAVFASLLRKCWDAGGYHLQLQALWAAQYFHGSDEPHRTNILYTVNSLETGHWALQSSIIEVLANFGEVHSGTNVDDLRAYIQGILAHSDEDHCRAASSIVSNQFEDDRILGPYYEAVDSLSATEKVRLFTMAARGTDVGISMCLDWTLDQLCSLVPTGAAALDDAAKAVFALFLDGPPADAVMSTEATNACLAATRGWAKFNRALPPVTADLTDEQRNWRLVAGLLFCQECDDVGGDPHDTWRQLQADRPHTILTLSTLDGTVYRSPHEQQRPALYRLYDDYPTELRELFEWALEHPAEVPALRVRRAGPDDFVIRALGYVGDLATVERLRVHTLDPEAGHSAVAAIRQIHQRLTT